MFCRSALLAITAVVCVGLAAGCASSGDTGLAAGAGPSIGVPLRLADCTDWKRSDVGQRLGTVRLLRDFAGGPTGSPGGHGSVLSEKQGYELFQNWCGNYYARGFKLYKLYTRAAAFKSLIPDQ